MWNIIQDTEKLIQNLNILIERSWNPFWYSNDYMLSSSIFELDWVVKYIYYESLQGKCIMPIPLPLFFIKESWLIEAANWNNISDRKSPEIDKKEIRWLHNKNYIYEKMWPMMIQEKIQYFNENILL